MSQKSPHTTQKNQNHKVNRKYKDRLFRYIFKNKKDLLDLYNAVNGTAYTNASDLIITTLSDAIYIGMKNDVGFLIGNCLNLYEHQSSINPNMPLRGLFYLVKMLQAYVELNHYNLYSSMRIELPFPRYIVFYNGDKEAPDCEELSLSDAFPKMAGSRPALECRATVLNINYGHNQELLNKCKRLSDYSYFIHQVREYLEQEYAIDQAIDCAMDDCIQKEILSDILIANRAEVKSMLLSTFDEKEYRKMLRDEAREEGFKEGRAEGRAEGQKEGQREGQKELNDLYETLLGEGRIEDLEKAIKDNDYRQKLLKEHS